MKKLQVPYNLDQNILDLYFDYKDYINEIYFAPSPEIFPTARQFPGGDLEEYNKKLCNLCTRSYQNGIETMLLLNGTNLVYTNNKLEEISALIYLLSLCHLTGVVVANPVLGEFIHNNFPNLKIRLSVLSNEDTVEKIVQIDKLGYINEICLTSNWLKDIDGLKKLRKLTKNLKYSIIVNSTCRLNCPLYGWHHMLFNSNTNWETYDFSLISDTFYKQTEKLEHNIFKSPFLLPEELHYFDNYIDYFKLEDRTLPTEKIKNFLFYYAHRINPEVLMDCIHGSCVQGPIQTIKISDLSFSWRKHMRNCKGQCYTCGLCDKKMEEYINGRH